MRGFVPPYSQKLVVRAIPRYFVTRARCGLETLRTLAPNWWEGAGKARQITGVTRFSTLEIGA
jgi:hypothetical protein